MKLGFCEICLGIQKIDDMYRMLTKKKVALHIHKKENYQGKILGKKSCNKNLNIG